MAGDNNGNFIPNEAADRLLSAHDGDMALLYLYCLRSGSFDANHAAQALCRTAGEISAAAEKLSRMGLLGQKPQNAESENKTILPDAELPEYKAEDITARLKEDNSFSLVVSEAQKVMGHMLSSVDLKKLFALYDFLGFPVEILLTLLNYCADTCREKYGPGRRLTMSFIEKEAAAWKENEVMTLEAADRYIHSRKLLSDKISGFKYALGIRDRELVPTERAYITQWINLGFDTEAAEIALDRTVSRCGSLKWKYMDAIMRRWHDNGFHTAAEIEAGDGKAPALPQTRENGGVDLDALIRDLKNKI